MKAGLRAGLFFASALFSPSALAQEASTSTAAVEAREAAMFGAPSGESEAPPVFTSSAGSDREAAMFGEPEPEGEVAPEGSAGFTFGEGTGAGERLFDKMADRDDFLDIGGQLWLWIQALGQDDTAFGDSSLSAPSFVDVYLDARPSDRVRAYARARTNFDPTIDESATSPISGTQSKARVRLDQLWLKFDVYRTVFLTLGKQRIRWGAGQIWNPTDFLNPNRLDSLNFLDTRLGVTLAKLHLPIESLGWNFYAIANVDDATNLKEIGGALRAEMLLGPAEVTVSTALQRDRPIRLGADISMPLWEFDFRVEAALLHDVRRPFFDEAADASFLDDIDTISTIEDFEAVLALFEAPAVDRASDWIPQVVVGVDYVVRYNDEDTFILALEYFFNDAGTDLPGTYLRSAFEGGFQALYAGRHYAAIAAYLNSPGDWDDSSFSLVGLVNFSDESGIVRFNYSVQILTYLRVNAFAATFVGARGGEFRLGFRIPPVDPALLTDGDGNPTALAEALPPELVSGFELQPPLWQAGATIVVDL